MPLVLIKRLQSDYLIRLDKLYNDYRQIFIKKTPTSQQLSYGSLSFGTTSLSLEDLFPDWPSIPERRLELSVDVHIKSVYNEREDLIREIDINTHT